MSSSSEYPVCFKPTPEIHAAIDNPADCVGKPAEVFSTHGGRPGQTDDIFKKWIEVRRIVPPALTDIHLNDSENETKIKDLIALAPYSGKGEIIRFF